MTFSVVPNWIIRDTDLSAQELLVYIALLNRADKRGRAWPSIATVAKEARCSESSVRRALKSLRERRFVDWSERRRDDGASSSNVYRVEIFNRRGFLPGTRGVSPWQGEGAWVAGEVDTREVDTGEVDLNLALAVEGPMPSEAQFRFLDDLATMLDAAGREDQEELGDRIDELRSTAEADALIQELWAVLEHEGRDSVIASVSIAEERGTLGPLSDKARAWIDRGGEGRFVA